MNKIPSEIDLFPYFACVFEQREEWSWNIAKNPSIVTAATEICLFQYAHHSPAFSVKMRTDRKATVKFDFKNICKCVER